MTEEEGDSSRLRMQGSLLTQQLRERGREGEKVQLAAATFYTTPPCLHASICELRRGRRRRGESGGECSRTQLSAGVEE